MSEHIEDAVSIGVRGCTALVVLLTPRVWTCPLTLLRSSKHDPESRVTVHDRYPIEVTHSL